MGVLKRIVFFRWSIARFFVEFLWYLPMCILNRTNMEVDQARVQPFQEETFATLIADWNDSIEDTIAAVKLFNEDIIKKFKAKEISGEALLAAIEPEPKKVALPSKTWIYWWRMTWGWGLLTKSPEDQAFLEYQHPDMDTARAAISGLMTSDKCHPAMLLNYDQIWRNSYQVSKFKMLFKQKEVIGARSKRTKASGRESKKCHAVKGARRSMTVP